MTDFQNLLRGASINQLAEIFQCDRRTVTNKLRSLKPSGARSGFPIFSIKEAAPLILKVKEDAKITAAIEKDFWDAQLKRQKYERENYDLWPTDQVEDVIATLLKIFRESYTMYIDNMETDSDVPAHLIEKLKRQGDHMLQTCFESLEANEFRQRSLTLRTTNEKVEQMKQRLARSAEEIEDDLKELGFE